MIRLILTNVLFVLCLMLNAQTTSLKQMVGKIQLLGKNDEILTGKAKIDLVGAYHLSKQEIDLASGKFLFILNDDKFKANYNYKFIIDKEGYRPKIVEMSFTPKGELPPNSLPKFILEKSKIVIPIVCFTKDNGQIRLLPKVEVKYKNKDYVSDKHGLIYIPYHRRAGDANLIPHPLTASHSDYHDFYKQKITKNELHGLQIELFPKKD